MIALVGNIQIARRIHLQALRAADLRGRGWALIPVASIIGVIFAIRYASATATWLTYLALIAVPILAAGALGPCCCAGDVGLARTRRLPT